MPPPDSTRPSVRDSALGRQLRSRTRAAIAATAGAAAICHDLYGPGLPVPYWLWIERALTSMLVLAVIAAVGGWDPAGLGLVATPRRGWAWWGRCSLRVGAGFGAPCLAILLALGALGVSLELGAPAGADIPELLALGLIAAPLLEESLYRLAIVPATARLVGPRAAIALNGLVFGLAHASSLSPTNALAGLVLSWAYLASGSLAVPIASSPGGRCRRACSGRASGGS